MRKIKKLLRKKAFTLIEMIVAMSIMVILVGAAMAMFNPVKSVISSLGNDMVTDNVTDTITNYLSDKLKTATTYNIAGYTTAPQREYRQSTTRMEKVGRQGTATRHRQDRGILFPPNEHQFPSPCRQLFIQQSFS